MNQDGAPTDHDIHAEVQNHADAIIQTCSYYPSDYHMVVHTRPDDMQQVQASLQSPFETSPTATLGMLDNLPVELVYMVLRRLDIRSFFHFRQVNRWARVLSAGIKDYRMVSRYGIEGLRGLLRAGIADYFDISDLYRPLVTDKCSTCGDFGTLLFLFTAERCCFPCLGYSDHYFVLSRHIFTGGTRTRISKRKLQRLAGPAVLKVVPGFYRYLNLYDRRSDSLRRPHAVRYLVHVERATQMLLAADVINQNVADKLTRSSNRSFDVDRALRSAAATAYPWYCLANAKLERGVSCYGCADACEQVYRAARRDFYDAIRHFSTEGFLSHFSTCLQAQRIWAETRSS
ncbi:hypothetical protein V8F06_013316 [Rhypophila decipiens]